MQTSLKEEAATLISQMPESKIRTVVQFMRFIYQEPDSEFEQQKREERDRNDLEIINANAERFNRDAEENLEFQTDIWSDE